MVSEKLAIINELGLHMRPAGLFVQTMAKFKSTVTILFGDKKINGKSVMKVMSACIKCGAQIEVQCEGPDEQEALQAAADLIRSGLGDKV